MSMRMLGRTHALLVALFVVFSLLFRTLAFVLRSPSRSSTEKRRPNVSIHRRRHKGQAGLTFVEECFWIFWHLGVGLATPLPL